jgi:hypothetical protein
MTTEQTLFKLGIPTYIQTITVDITSQNELKIADTVPLQMGWIYGLNTYADTVDPDNTDLISTADASNLYLKIVQGDRNFVNAIRIDDLLFPSATQSGRYMEVNIPGTISIDQSLILNPTGITEGRLLLMLRYVAIWDLEKLIAENLFRNGGFVRTK